jgi:hypothetical protein
LSFINEEKTMTREEHSYATNIRGLVKHGVGSMSLPVILRFLGRMSPEELETFESDLMAEASSASVNMQERLSARIMLEIIVFHREQS